MKAVVMNGTGGREMLEHVERPDPVTGRGQALVEIAFAGVNFMDIGVRQGMAWTDTPYPKILGVEGVGRIVAGRPGRRTGAIIRFPAKHLEGSDRLDSSRVPETGRLALE
jgi:NADPH:quinone reductase-like Zn-dependent oxidoreductase